MGRALSSGGGAGKLSFGIGYNAKEDVKTSDANNYGGDGDGTHKGATNYSEPTIKLIKNMQ
jgi:hypothetical protein